jgi:hypothetical protein
MAFTGIDKFGNKFATVAITRKGDKWPRGYVEIGSKLYKLTVTDGKKDNKNGDPIINWVKIQEVSKDRSSNNRKRVSL